MSRKLVFIFFFMPLLAWAAVLTIMSAGNWNDPGIWSMGNIADNITESVNMNNNIGVISIQNGDAYTVSDIDMNNGNTLTIEIGGSLIVGSMTDVRDLVTDNNSTLNVHGNLEIWGNVDVNNDLVFNIPGTLIIHGDMELKNSASVDIQGDVTIEGDMITGDSTEVNVDGSLDVSGSASVGVGSNLSGSGLINIGGGCTGPATFCLGGPLDTLPPTISGCPLDLSVILSDSNCQEAVNWTEPTADDNIGVESFTSTHVPGDIFGVGITTVNYTATDEAGNSATCSFQVSALDNTPPVIFNCPTDIVISISGTGCAETVNWIAPTASDNCSVTEFTSTNNPGDVFGLGITTVTYTATDESGNTSSCSFTIEVEDHIEPQFEACPFEISIAEFDPYKQTAVVTWQTPIVTDNCENVTLSSNYNSGDGFPPGKTMLITTATDGSGNTSVCEFEVEIEGNLLPVATSPHIVEAIDSEPLLICLDVTDPDGDELFVKDISYDIINGETELPAEVGNLCITYTSDENYVGKDIFFITVCDTGSGEACVDVEVQIVVSPNLNLTIYKVFTPDNDNINDYWIIENIEEHPNNHVVVFDRWGGLIFETTGYNNENIVWNGRSNQSGQNVVSPGTYFYKIDLGNGLPVQKGSIELVL